MKERRGHGKETPKERNRMRDARAERKKVTDRQKDDEPPEEDKGKEEER